MYLREVEANPQPSPYASLIDATKAAGREYWQIWHLFAFRPEVTSPLASFTEGVMRAPSSVSLGLRELIAAYTSWINECQFCWRSHAAVAAELLGSEELVRAVLNDPESSPLPENEKALLRFAAKITTDLPEMNQSDVDTLHAQGWTDEAIYFTILVVSLFNFYNRWVTTSGVHPVSEEAHRSHGKRLALSGYEPKHRLQGMQNTLS
uniref:Carboxymuconolactone decarboxylase n=2 Tax=Paracidobacterium acidisoli TaxID=2303751 RepID=A0A372IMB3_9BACT